jgi:hypothetical protein
VDAEGGGAEQEKGADGRATGAQTTHGRRWG